MAYNYRVRKKVDKTKPEKQVRYYAVPVSSKLVSVKKLSRIISDRCSLTGSDVVACIDALAHVIEEQIHDGNSVCLKGLGIFWLAAGSRALTRLRNVLHPTYLQNASVFCQKWI